LKRTQSFKANSQKQLTLYYQTDFVIVTRNPKLIADARLKDAVPIQALPGLKVWTDHHNNLFDVLR
jgi:hypothetical protein